MVNAWDETKQKFSKTKAARSRPAKAAIPATPIPASKAAVPAAPIRTS
jgi:hypothetical protein